MTELEVRRSGTSRLWLPGAAAALSVIRSTAASAEAEAETAEAEARYDIGTGFGRRLVRWWSSIRPGHDGAPRHGAIGDLRVIARWIVAVIEDLGTRRRL